MNQNTQQKSVNHIDEFNRYANWCMSFSTKYGNSFRKEGDNIEIVDNRTESNKIQITKKEIGDLFYNFKQVKYHFDQLTKQGLNNEEIKELFSTLELWKYFFFGNLPWDTDHKAKDVISSFQNMKDLFMYKTWVTEFKGAKNDQDKINLWYNIKKVFNLADKHVKDKNSTVESLSNQVYNDIIKDVEKIKNRYFKGLDLNTLHNEKEKIIDSYNKSVIASSPTSKKTNQPAPSNIVLTAEQIYKQNKYLQAAATVDFDNAPNATRRLLVSSGLLTEEQLEKPNETIQAIFTSFYTMKLVREENATKKTIQLLKSIMEKDGVEITPENILKYLWNEQEQRSRLAAAMVGQQIGNKKVSQGNAKWWEGIFKIVYERSGATQVQVPTLQSEHNALLRQAEELINNATDYQKQQPAFQSLNTIYQANKDLSPTDITQETNNALKNAIEEAKKAPLSPEQKLEAQSQKRQLNVIYSYNNEFANIDHPLAKHLHKELQKDTGYFSIIASSLYRKIDQESIAAASIIAEDYVNAVKSNIQFFAKFYDQSKSFGENVVQYYRNLQVLDLISLLGKRVPIDNQGNTALYTTTSYFIDMGYIKKEGEKFVATDDAPQLLKNMMKRGSLVGTAEQILNQDAFEILAHFGLATIDKKGKVSLDEAALNKLSNEEQEILKNFVNKYNSDKTVAIYESEPGKSSPAEVMVKLVKSYIQPSPENITERKETTTTQTPPTKKEEQPTTPPQPTPQPPITGEKPESTQLPPEQTRIIIGDAWFESNEASTYRYNNEFQNIRGLEKIHEILSKQWGELVNQVKQKLGNDEVLTLQKIQNFVNTVISDDMLKSYSQSYLTNINSLSNYIAAMEIRK
ncbi:MAG: hypothetical protein QXT25_01010 [Candidatus Anstonellaceae archaeon]